MRSKWIAFCWCIAICACVDIQGPMPTPVPPNELISQVQISSRAVMMKIGDTLRLSVNATAMDESTIPIANEKVHWKSLDPVQVYTDTLGNIIGRRQTPLPVSVVASYQYGLVTKADTIPVFVTATSVDVTDIKLVVIDSNRVGAGAVVGSPRVRADLYNSDTLVRDGRFIPVTVPFPVIATYSPVGGVAGDPVYLIINDKGYLGKFWVRASLNLYGVDVKDSVEFIGTYAASVDVDPWLGINADGSFGVFSYVPPTFTLQPCGIISMRLFASKPIDVVFSDSISASDGCAEIPVETLKTLASKKFYPLYGDFVDSNINGFPGQTVAFRRSSMVGQVSYYLRDHETKERYPFAGEFLSAHYTP